MKLRQQIKKILKPLVCTGVIPCDVCENTLPSILQAIAKRDVEAVGEDETPDEYIAKHLTETEISSAVQAVEFHARNKLRSEIKKRLEESL